MEGVEKSTHVTTAVKDDTNDLALLHLRQVQLCQSFTGIQIVLNNPSVKMDHTV